MAVADPALAEQVRQVVAAAGRGLVEQRGCVESPPRIDRRQWRTAGVVVMDEHVARWCVAERPARDGATVLVYAAAAPQEGWRLAVHAKAGHVLSLPQQERELVRLVGEAVESRVGGGRVIAVVGARGGAGASTLAAATALVAARSGARSLAVDLDPLGGGLDVVLGMEREPGLRWADLSLSGGRVSATALHEALPRRGSSLSVLAAGCGELGKIETEAALAVVDSARSAGDTVVVDLPRQWGDLQQAVVEAADCAVVVLPAELRAIAAGRVLSAALSRLCASVGAVARGPSPGGLRLARAAAEAGLPLLGVMHHEHQIAVSAERGGLVLRGRSSVLRAAEAVLGRCREKTARR
ncbi:septum site-determining protein Ssd [Segniliparus sp.]|uniref:septum site-determining protein Ssd n=1 Tax=Segniliparus sp. TaxID=2804064 RepID=UPI003F66E245